MKRILLFGRDGQVGWELQRALAPLGTVTAPAEADVDFQHLDALRQVVRTAAPDIVVNAAAYTAVDRAETEPDLAAIINDHALRVLAEETRKLNALLVHYSTDYVFDGTKSGAYDEDDAPNPLGVYGRTKLGGEHAVQSVGGRYLLFRTSWVYGRRGSNFVRTILRLARERDELKVVKDQIGAPTSAELIADVTALCLRSIACCPERFRDASGLYHLVSAGETSWHDYASYIVRTVSKLDPGLRLSPESIRAVPTEEYPTPAKRPLNSRLSTAKLQRVFGIECPHWKSHLDRLLHDLAERTQA